MRSVFHLSAAAFFLLAAGVVHGASFDCGRASSLIERLICGDAKISQLDDDLTVSYARALDQVPAPEILKKHQRGWLANVRNRCSSTECLTRAYKARIAQLTSPPPLHRKPPSLQEPDDAESCHAVAHYANRGEIDLLAVGFLATLREEEELKSVFGGDFSIIGSAEYWSVDLNNDGIRDHLAISTEGTMRVDTGYAKSGTKGTTVDTVSDFEAGNIDLTVLAVGGRYYILSGYGKGLSKLWRMSKDGVFQKVCGFSARKEPVVQLAIGQGDPVCTGVAQNKVQHLDYRLTHALGMLPDEERFWSKHPLDGMAKADIDNDGKLDNIVRIDFTHGGGRGCSVTYLAVADASRTTLPDTKLNKLLLNELGGFPCGPQQDVFVHGGTTYLDAQAGAGNRTIYRIQGDTAAKVCEFRGRILFDAIDTD